MTTDDLETLKAQLRLHEGTRLKLYTDTVGKLTIGCGRNLADRGITVQEAEYLLSNDIMAALDDCRRQWAWFSTLDSVRQCVLVNMVFNMGLPRMLNFKVMLRHAEVGRWAQAAEAMLQSKWATQVGQRAVTLAEQMRTGQWVG